MFFTKKKVVRIEPTLKLPAVVKKIAFIDGDQELFRNILAYDEHIKGRGYETHYVTFSSTPRKIEKMKTEKFNVVNLCSLNLSRGKEITDKYIAAHIQKAVSDGYNDIIVVSSDYDFVDIFKMAAQICDMSKIHFKLIVPKPQGRIIDTQVAGLDIVKMGKPKPPAKPKGEVPCVI